MITFQQIQFRDKVALIRVDYNVPLNKDGTIRDTTRIDETLPTIREVIAKGGTVFLVSHLGRPEGKKDEKYSLEPVVAYLEEALQREVLFVEEMDKDLLSAAIESSKVEGTIVMFENIRFFAEEEKNDVKFSKFFASFADVYVNEAFSASHREHASIVGFPKYTREKCAGLRFQHEVEILQKLLQRGEHPKTLILGGAKMDTKAGLISRFIGSYDNFLIGGALGNTFLAAQGFEIGDSLAERKQIHLAQETMLNIEAHKERLILPCDGIVVDDMEEGAPRMDIPMEDVEEGMQIMDIGLKTVEQFVNVIKHSRTILWNGPLGFTEMEKFSVGTKLIAEAILMNKNAVSVVGGGDTVDSLKRIGIDLPRFSFVSTSGGAMIEFFEKAGQHPGIQSLR